MKACYRCGITEDKALLYEGISVVEIVHICRKCFCERKIPLIDTKDIDMAQVNRRESVRERLTNMAGLKDHPVPEKKKVVESEDLKKIVEENFKKDVPEEPMIYDQLRDHFHWVIMRKRRGMKLTQSEFAKKIFEPVVVVEHLERGILPKDYLALIRKVEGFFDIKLFKEGERRFVPSLLANESKISSGLKISDLKEGRFEPEFNSDDEVDIDELDLKELEKVVGKPLEKVEKRNSKKDKELSEEEIRKLIFRK